MKKYIKYFLIAAAFAVCAAVYSCGKKSDKELSLSVGAKAEETDSSGVIRAADGSDDAQPRDPGSAPVPEQTPDSAAPDTAAPVPSDASATSAASDVTEGMQEQQPADAACYVYVCGAVKTPDVYRLAPGSRIIDAVKTAGGFTDEADSDYLNLAAGIADGQKIYVPTRQEVTEGLVPAPELNTTAATGTGGVAGTQAAAGGQTQAGTVTADAKSGKVNINTATAEELKTLNGIGDKRANDIIEYRSSHGSFKSIEDIKKVNGIKDGIYAKICDDIEV